MTYVSPPGTLAWQCQVCGQVTYDEEGMDKSGDYWAKNPQHLLDRLKKMKKAASKLGRGQS